MPGFVDVSNMSALEIKRLGQMDEEDPRDSDYSHRNLARRNPYGYGRRRVSAQVTAGGGHPGWAVADVWAAACAAHRVNGGYFKEEQWMHNATPPYIAKRRNRDVMMEFLNGAEQLLPEDIAQGQECQNFHRNDVTFRALKSKLTEFDSAINKVLAVEDRFFPQKHKYELAVIACMPQSQQRSVSRQENVNRVKFATGGLLGKPGEKITASVEVIACNYSQQYNIFWIRGITDADQPVMFSNKESWNVGTHLTIQGKVKAHRDDLTQLNYVKIL